MRRRALVLLSTLALCGCRLSDVPPPRPLELALAGELGLKGERAPLPYRVAVAPLQIAFQPRELFPGDVMRHGSVPDPERVREQLVKVLRAANLFRRVTPRGDHTSTRTQVYDEAWKERDDLVLEIELRSYHQEYLGHTSAGSQLAWFVLYTGAVWPAWLVPIDRYGVGIEAHVSLRNVQGSGTPLIDQTYVVPVGKTVQELRPWDRELVGFLDLGALWNVETSLDESNWRAIDTRVGPHAWRRLHLALLRDLEREVGKPLRDPGHANHTRVMQKVRKRFALVVGVSKYSDAAIGAAPQAAKDAGRLAAFWSSAAGGGLKRGRDLAVLLDAQATKAAILEGIQAAGARATPADEVVLYFAGYGSTTRARGREASAAVRGVGGFSLAMAAEASPTFLVADSRSRDLRRSGLKLSELGQALRSLRAGQVLVVFDASFARPRSSSRTFKGTRRRGPSTLELVRPLCLGEGRAALFAAQPGQAALELRDGKAGLFSHLLLAGLRGAADADRDGRVGVRELFRFTRAQVRSRSGMEGWSQVPAAFGLGSSSLGWPR